MRENNIPTDHVNVFPDGKSPVSLAFLNEQSDAEYIFYKDYPKQRLDVLYPKLEEDDIVMVALTMRSTRYSGRRFWNCWTRHARRKQSSITTRTSALHIRTKQ